MAPPKAKAQTTQQVSNTAARNIANAQKAGLLPSPKPRKAAKPKRAARPKARPNRANTPMVKKVRKLEQNSAMY